MLIVLLSEQHGKSTKQHKYENGDENLLNFQISTSITAGSWSQMGKRDPESSAMALESMIEFWKKGALVLLEWLMQPSPFNIPAT